MQGRLVGFFDPFLANHIGTAIVARLTGLIKFVEITFGNTTDVPDHVCGDLALWILSDPARPQFNTRKIKRVRRKPGRFRFIQIIAKHDAGIATGLRDATLEAPLIHGADMDDWH